MTDQADPHSEEKKEEDRKKVLRDYVSKVNDRNLQRKRESGLTTYALISVLAYIIFFLIKNYPSKILNEYYLETICVSTLFYNIFFYTISIANFYSLFIPENSSIKIERIKNEVDPLTNIISNFFIFVFPLILNILSFVYLFFIRDNFSFYFLLNFIFFIFLNYIVFYPNKRDKQPVKSQFKATGGSFLVSQDQTCQYKILTGILIILLIYSFIDEFIITVRFSKSEVILYLLHLYSVPVILYKLLMLTYNEKLSSNLENFEYEIIIKDYSSHKIKEEIQHKHFGFFIDDYQNAKILLLKEIVEEVNDTISSLENDYFTMLANEESKEVIDKWKASSKKYFELKLDKIQKEIDEIKQIKSDIVVDKNVRQLLFFLELKFSNNYKILKTEIFKIEKRLLE